MVQRSYLPSAKLQSARGVALGPRVLPNHLGCAEHFTLFGATAGPLVYSDYAWKKIFKRWGVGVPENGRDWPKLAGRQKIQKKGVNVATEISQRPEIRIGGQIGWPNRVFAKEIARKILEIQKIVKPWCF